MLLNPLLQTLDLGIEMNDLLLGVLGNLEQKGLMLELISLTL
jgi:hypothetical protein